MIRSDKIPQKSQTLEDGRERNSSHDAFHCASCENQFTGRYCPLCGEKVLDPSERSLTYLLADLLENVTSLDNRFIRTLKAFLLDPGGLGVKFQRGQRVNYMKPITFFLLINLLYVLFTPLSDFNVSLHDQLKSQSYSNFVEPLVGKIVESKSLSWSDFGQKYNQIAAVTSRSLIIISVPLLAVFIAILFYSNKRQKKQVFADHLVFSLYIYAWILSWIVLAQIPSFAVDRLALLFDSSWEESDGYFIFLMAGILAYLYIASKRVFELTHWGTIIRLPLLLFAIFASHVGYRFVQLWVIIAMI